MPSRIVAKTNRNFMATLEHIVRMKRSIAVLLNPFPLLFPYTLWIRTTLLCRFYRWY